MPRTKQVEIEEEDIDEEEEVDDSEDDEDYEEQEDEDAEGADDEDEDDEEEEPEEELTGELDFEQKKKLHGHQNIRANVCFDCYGPLLSQAGSFAEFQYDDGSKSFAAAICLFCKHLRIMTEREHVVDAKEMKGVIARLSGHNDGVNYAVACWILTVIDQDAGTTTDRRYCVQLDGRITTRKDVFDLRRTLKSLQTVGWEVYTPKIKVKNVEHALHLVSEQLESRGYRRQF